MKEYFSFIAKVAKYYSFSLIWIVVAFAIFLGVYNTEQILQRVSRIEMTLAAQNQAIAIQYRLGENEIVAPAAREKIKKLVVERWEKYAELMPIIENLNVTRKDLMLALYTWETVKSLASESREKKEGVCMIAKAASIIIPSCVTDELWIYPYSSATDSELFSKVYYAFCILMVVSFTWFVVIWFAYYFYKTHKKIAE